MCGDVVNTANALQNIKGTIVLAGAGKMGGAMLTGWLAQGLDARRVVGDRAASFRRDPRARGQGHSPQSIAEAMSAPSLRWWSR